MTAPLPARWDCHAHVIDSLERFPLSPGRSYDPPIAPLEDYTAMLDRHAITRGVLVQPSVYGFDNRCLLDALERAGGRLRGVAVPHPDSPDSTLEAMHRRGVRGIRCNLLNPGGLQPESALRWLPFLREARWHVGLHVSIHVVPDLRALVDRFDVPVVIDHMGRPAPDRLDPSSPDLRRLVDLVRDGRCYVKLSAPYRLSSGPPPWDDVTPLAHALLDADPHACVWATDWPHTDTPVAVNTDSLFNALADWTQDPATQRIVLEETPDRLFGGE